MKTRCSYAVEVELDPLGLACSEGGLTRPPYGQLPINLRLPAHQAPLTNPHVIFSLPNAGTVSSASFPPSRRVGRRQVPTICALRRAPGIRQVPFYRVFVFRHLLPV